MRRRRDFNAEFAEGAEKRESAFWQAGPPEGGRYGEWAGLGCDTLGEEFWEKNNG